MLGSESSCVFPAVMDLLVTVWSFLFPLWRCCWGSGSLQDGPANAGALPLHRQLFSLAGVSCICFMSKCCCWKAGTEGYNSSHFKINSFWLHWEISHVRELLHWGSSSAQGAHLTKGPMRCLLTSCRLWVNLYDYSIFSCLCPLSTGKHYSFPCLWLQPSTSKIRWSFWGKVHYISHAIMFSPSFEHFLRPLLRKNWPSQSNPPNRVAPWSFFVFYTFFASAKLAFFPDLVNTHFWNFDALKFLCRQDAINYCSSFGVRILSEEPFLPL